LDFQVWILHSYITVVPIVGYILTALIAYLLGSIPTGFLVAKARGTDIRTIGSGNIGDTNVFRYLGTKAGVFVLVMDALKGWLAVAVVAVLLANWFNGSEDLVARERLQIIAGLSAILGHNYTCWLHFKGGKGIATSAGVLVGLVPGALLIIFGVWIVVFALSRFVSLASISASFALPFAAWLTGHTPTMIAITAAMAALAIFKHKSNIQRLLSGTENRFAFKRTSTTSAAPKSTS
jgi:glycerol-3-phosphate acyltransferase PlsY